MLRVLKSDAQSVPTECILTNVFVYRDSPMSSYSDVTVI